MSAFRFPDILLVIALIALAVLVIQGEQDIDEARALSHQLAGMVLHQSVKRVEASGTALDTFGLTSGGVGAECTADCGDKPDVTCINNECVAADGVGCATGTIFDPKIKRCFTPQP